MEDTLAGLPRSCQGSGNGGTGTWSETEKGMDTKCVHAGVGPDVATGTYEAAWNGSCLEECGVSLL